MAEPNCPRYTLGEEIFNAVSHGVGAALALVGYGYMLALSVHFGDIWASVSVTIYCITLFAMFISSTCYHALPYPAAKRVLRILDHCAIYLLIAGTYTPYTLINLRGPLGWTIFAVIWAMAVIGIVLNAIDLKRYAKISVVCYVLMGWAVVFALRPLLVTLPLGGVVTLAAGGVFYTVGVVFYVIRKIPYFHPVWHLFVLAGAITHFYSILLYVLPVNFATV
ncbi:MAG: hemolysin III family protein [Intestinibacillus sp.]